MAVLRPRVRRRCPVSTSRETQILAFRRTAGAFDARIAPGQRSLRRAAWVGLHDSMPPCREVPGNRSCGRCPRRTSSGAALISSWPAATSMGSGPLRRNPLPGGRESTERTRSLSQRSGSPPIQSGPRACGAEIGSGLVNLESINSSTQSGWTITYSDQKEWWMPRAGDLPR